LVSDPYNFLNDADNRPGLVFTAVWVLDLIGTAISRLTNLKRSLAGNDFESAKNCDWHISCCYINTRTAENRSFAWLFFFLYQRHTVHFFDEYGTRRIMKSSVFWDTKQ
jgi:hypothetical protein